MDRSGFGDFLLTPKTRFSLSSVRKGGLLSDSRRQTKSSLSGKSFQSTQVIYRSHFHVVETFGTTLPVLVREALTFSERNIAVSVRLSNDGWAWFVCGRRLLIWQYRFDSGTHEEGRRRFINSQCRELTLPSSDLAYKAELVVVYIAPGNQVPSCIAVSPEGIIRYWPSIAHESSSVEVNAALQGQECDSLTDINPIGFVLATTTATVVLVQPQMSGGRYNIVCRPFKLSQGWLKGIGHLIPSLLFGSIQSSHIMETKLVKITAVKNSVYDSCEWMLYILAGHTLQKWILVGGELERLYFECDINQLAVDAFQKTIWEPCGGNPNEILVWLLDMQPVENGVTILLAGTNPQISPQVNYALGTLVTNSVIQPSRFDRFCPLKYTGFYRESDEAELLGFRFLISGSSALLYKPKNILAVSAVNFADEMDHIDFLNSNDQILGGAVCKGIPVFFSTVHGFVSVLPSDSTRIELSNVSVSDMATIDPSSASIISEQMNVAISDYELEDLTLSKDSVVQMKAAFLYFVRRNAEMAENIISSVFPYEEEPAMDVDSLLDIVVTKVAVDIINDIPAGDPRWANIKSSDISIGSSVSLQILNQLEDKQRALEWFFCFLKETKLWERLAAVTIRDTVMATTLVLCEYAEKIVAAIALKNLHSGHSSLIDQCIKHVVGQEKLSHGLTYQDFFYREVSKIAEGLQVLNQYSENLAHSSRRPQEIAIGLCEANIVFLGVLWEVLQWRKQKKEAFSPKSSVSKSCEYLPWIAAPGSEGLRDNLTNQHSLTLKYGARATGELELKNRFYEQLVSITDVILDGRRSHVNSVRGEPKYEALCHQYEDSRQGLITIFIQDEKYEQAAVLAEKYHDFQSLIQICELTNNIERLDNYCEKFSEENFPQHVFNWYLRERKTGRLFQQFRGRSKSLKQRKELSNFLSDHPSLLWLQDVFSNQYKDASSTLRDLAKHETELLSRKKTMLSLAKLSLLASEDEKVFLTAEEQLLEFDSELELVAHQEDLPANVLVAYGYDVTRLGVLTPAELIKLYICEENENVTEVDFKKALDLLEYVEDDVERNELRHSIWCNAILRDSWKDIDSDSSIENILNLLFFKLVDLVEFMGGSPEEFLPPINTILDAQELGDLRNDRHFQYLIRVGYEHFQKSSGEQFNP